MKSEFRSRLIPRIKLLPSAMLLLLRRHLAVVDASQQFGLLRLSGYDLVAVNEALAIQNVVEAALHRALLTVAAVAVRLQDVAGTTCQDFRIGVGVGWCRSPQRPLVEQVEGSPKTDDAQKGNAGKGRGQEP